MKDNSFLFLPITQTSYHLSVTLAENCDFNKWESFEYGTAKALPIQTLNWKKKKPKFTTIPPVKDFAESILLLGHDKK